MQLRMANKLVIHLLESDNSLVVTDIIDDAYGNLMCCVDRSILL